jgi:Uma2 family endonuclease
MNRANVAIPRRIGPRSAGMSMTHEEFDAIPEGRWDDRYRYELIRGVLVVTPPPGPGERSPNDDLGHLLRSYKETHPQGAALDATLPEQTVYATPQRRRADRAIWAGLGRVPDEEKDTPTIVIEFVSASRRDAERDYEAKRDEYLAAGVAEYWIIDRFKRIMTVYRNTPGGAVSLVIKATETYQTDRLPGFVLPLSRLLARADDFPRKRRRRPPARGAE